MRSKALRRGMTLSCRCYTKEVTTKRNATRDFLVVRNAREYRVWFAMLRRCYSHEQLGYADYGGRGIAVCERWRESFAAFLEDMGKRPQGTSIDRIDNDGNYEPGNCRWATCKEQNRNKRTSRYIEHNGARKTVAEWSEISGIQQAVLWGRVFAMKWSVERAMTQPVRPVGKRVA